MEELLTKAVEGLIASGPVAILSAVACYILWKRNLVLQAEKDELQKELKTTLSEQAGFFQKLVKLGNGKPGNGSAP